MMISSRVETSKFVTRLFSTIGYHFDIWPVQTLNDIMQICRVCYHPIQPTH